MNESFAQLGKQAFLEAPCRKVVVGRRSSTHKDLTSRPVEVGLVSEEGAEELVQIERKMMTGKLPICDEIIEAV